MQFDHIITTVETHTGGEPFRIVTSGLPRMQGATIVQRRAWAEQNVDALRTALMLEPRGHADMYGGFLTEPISPDADFGVIFVHNQGYSDHCGHGVIALATAAVQLGWVVRREPETRVGIDAPCGFIEALVQWDGRRASAVRFVNVPSYVERAAVAVETPSFGVISGDIAFGGAFYFYTDGQQYGLDVRPNRVEELVRFGAEVKDAANRAFQVVHPRIPELNHIYGTIIYLGAAGEPEGEPGELLRVCRSPGGSVRDRVRHGRASGYPARERVVAGWGDPGERVHHRHADDGSRRRNVDVRRD
jgi:proline racemase